MTVRLDLKRLMKDARYANAYALVQAVKAAGGKVSDATIYRLVRDGGRVVSVRAGALEALAKVFDCEVADLFQRKGKV